MKDNTFHGKAICKRVANVQTRGVWSDGATRSLKLINLHVK